MWQIQHLPDSLPEKLENTGDSYIYSEDEQPFVNEMSVAVTIQRTEMDVFKVLSTAGGTEVECFITAVFGDYSDVMDNAITSQGDYILKGPTTVDPPEGEEHGPVKNYTGDWPSPEELSEWYSRDVDKDNPCDQDFIDLEGSDTTIGPLYVNSDFSIYNSSNTEATLTLIGTLYITGDTLIGKTGKDFTLNLNGNTIFVESDTAGSQYALEIGGKCIIDGSGCIIAVGDILFKPGLNSTSFDYVFVMSVIGKTYMQPNGDFYGTLAGSSEVEIQNGDFHWTDPSGVEGGLNVPGGGGGGGAEWKTAAWQIS